MHRRWIAASIVAAVSAASPADACRINRPLVPDHVRQADAVVVGRIVDYRVIWRRASPQYPPYDDHARFRVAVETVLKGGGERTYAVMWRNSTFALPRSLPPVPHLIALRRLPPERGSPSWEVLQTPCSPPFMVEPGSAEAIAIRRSLSRR